MLARIAAIVTSTCLLASTLAWRGQAPVRVNALTWNLFAGGDFSPEALASLNAMGNIYRGVQRTDFRKRAKVIADAIATAPPLVIGLQEAALWRIQSPPSSSPATSVRFDFVKLLQQELEARGLRYDVARSLVVIDFEAPGLVANQFIDIRYTDRNVVLVRRTPNLVVISTLARRFADSFSLPTPLGPLEFRRGWISADLEYRGRPFRFVNTHLEVFSSTVNLRQARQLAAWLDAQDDGTPIMLAADFNSGPASSGLNGYRTFVDRGWDDAWTVHHAPLGGPTCCQHRTLRNDNSLLIRRIDAVLYRGPLNVVATLRLGESPADKTPTGLWPSDHAGVLAKFDLLGP